jgi:HNH endonuclease
MIQFGDPRLPERFWSKVLPEPNTGCWLWIASLTKNGYGKFGLSGPGWKLAHRVAYEALIGPVPDGFELDHKCRVRPCVNPYDLEPVTSKENKRRSPISGPRTFCPLGHEYAGDNLRVDPRTGQRFCKACNTLAARKRRCK